MINDFRNTTAVIEYTDFGSVKLWGAWVSRQPHRGYHLAKDSIGVFLNFRQVGDFRDKAGALNLVNRLVAGAPSEAKLQEFMEVMIKAL